MKAILLFFDSLNKKALSPYNCDWIHTPNFQRLANQSVQFENHFVGSMPCMPARREIHTGRYNFLHRCWGPLEPFDNSMPEILKNNGIYTHLTTDHVHYWTDGGANYMTRFNSHEISRGQGEDPIKGVMKEIQRDVTAGQHSHKDNVNRKLLQSDKDFPIDRTFQWGKDFIHENHSEDNWFLNIETFDPHEPFIAQERFRKLYPHHEDPIQFDWPHYGGVRESEEEIQHCRYEYASCVSMCDHYLGQVLDLMDQYDLWKDTLLIVSSDHGFYLGERNTWSKGQKNWGCEFSNIPLFVWDPRSGVQNESRDQLTQTIDIAPTILDFFNQPIPKDMLGKPIQKVINDKQKIHDSILYGWFGRDVVCRDERYLYVQGTNTSNSPLFNYTLSTSHFNSPFSPETELQDCTLHPGFPFTKGCPVLKVPAEGNRVKTWGLHKPRPLSMLFDLQNDPKQEEELKDPEIQREMQRKMISLMKENDAPAEQYTRLNLE